MAYMLGAQQRSITLPHIDHNRATQFRPFSARSTPPSKTINRHSLTNRRQSNHQLHTCACACSSAHALEMAPAATTQPGQSWLDTRRMPVIFMTALLLLLVGMTCGAATAVGASAGPATPAPALNSIQGVFKALVSFILHLDKHLAEIVTQYGTTTYLILWGIVFCETGLVLTPFLPGDSLLFAAGTFAGMGRLNFLVLMAVFISAAFIGDAVNYAVGNYVGAKAVKSNLIKAEYITKTEKFYQKYGPKTIVLARFVPIIRTFAPFVAGIGSMNYSTFWLYNIGGAVLWSVLFTGAGFFFGQVPFVQHNFTVVVLGIVLISVLPVAWEIYAARREAAAAHNEDGPKAF